MEKYKIKTLELFNRGTDKISFDILTKLAKKKYLVVSDLTKKYGCSRTAFLKKGLNVVINARN